MFVRFALVLVLSVSSSSKCSGKGCGLCFWHSLDFLLPFFFFFLLFLSLYACPGEIFILGTVWPFFGKETVLLAFCL